MSARGLLYGPRRTPARSTPHYLRGPGLDRALDEARTVAGDLLSQAHGEPGVPFARAIGTVARPPFRPGLRIETEASEVSGMVRVGLFYEHFAPIWTEWRPVEVSPRWLRYQGTYCEMGRSERLAPEPTPGPPLWVRRG